MSVPENKRFLKITFFFKFSLRNKKINNEHDNDGDSKGDDDHFNEDVFSSLNEMRLEMTDMDEKLNKLEYKLVISLIQNAYILHI